MKVQMISNTDKEYPCVNCGGTNVSIIREGHNPRLKCNACSFLFDGANSLAAQEADAIPESSPETLEAAFEPDREYAAVIDEPDKPVITNVSQVPHKVPIPKLPKYVFISKDRKYFNFVTEKSLKSQALSWEASGRKYDLFELTAKKSVVKLDIS